MILVLEYISGGDLFDRIIECRKLDEDIARKLFRQLFSAVMYCHNNMMIHRDLKLENILLDENDNLKIIDFGFVRTYSKDPNMMLKTYCGSLYYCAPEMIDGTPYPGPSSDIWSLGVILYVITNGYLPFKENNLEDLHKRLKTANYDKGEYSSEGMLMKSQSLECNQLIAKMIVPNPNDRENLASLAGDPWLNHGYDSIPSSHSTLSNDLLQFREEIAKKIEFLESQESSVESEIKRNGFQDLSLLIPIEESVPKPHTMPQIEKSRSAPHAFSLTPSSVIRIIDKEKSVAFRLSSDALIPIGENDSHSKPGTETSTSTSSYLPFDTLRENAYSPMENETTVCDDTMKNNTREYSSAPTERSNLETIIDEKMDVIELINGQKVALSDWKTRFLNWFHKPASTQNAPENGRRTKRRFSFLLRK
jgi:serine/threonine protein kinase